MAGSDSMAGSDPAAGAVAAPFGRRLRAALRRRGPLCVGIDPHPALLRRWGLDDDVKGLSQFVRTAVEALAERVAIVKPQSAFFERHGARGIAVLESAIVDLRAAGALVLLDAKRGDIGSTMAAYADAYLDPASPLGVDAITAHPYLGVGALEPLLSAARRHHRGVFVLAVTSNPEGLAVQRARTAGGGTVAQAVIDEISQLNQGEPGVTEGAPMGSFGVVVGATVGAAGLDLTRLAGPVLAPGLGAQGASAADLPARFGAALPMVVPVYARAVLAAGPGISGLRQAAARAAEECRAVLGGVAGNPDTDPRM